MDTKSKAVYLMKKLLRLSYWQLDKNLSGYGLPRLRAVRYMERLVRAMLRSDYTEVLGHRMHLDPRDILNLSVDGIYEPLVTAVVQKEVGPDNVVLDIGAHIGYYTLIFANLVGRQGKVFAFEPVPSNFALLQKNVQLNGYHGVALIQKAVSDKEDKAVIYLNEDNSGDNRIYDSHDGRRSVEIETVALDSYFVGFQGRIDFIKMDIQGAEHAALCGMADLLKRNRGVKLVTEFWPFGLAMFGVAPKSYLQLLVDHGFHLSNVDERLGKVLPVSIPELLAAYTVQKQNQTNLFCTRD
jgi:FkbM family methyltransferase